MFHRYSRFLLLLLPMLVAAPLLAVDEVAFGLNEEGRALMEQGKYAEAKAKFLEAVETDGFFSEARINAARAAEMEDPPDWVTVKTQYLTVLTYDEENVEAILGSGLYFVKASDFEEAKARLEKVIEMEGENGAARYGLGNMYYKMKRYDQASAEYEKAISLDPGAYPTALLRVGVNEYNNNRKTKKFDKATDYLTRFLERGKEKEDLAIAHNRLGLIHYYTKQYQKAMTHFGEAKKLDPTDYTNDFFRGVIYAQTQNLAKAEEEFKSCLEKKPGYGDAHFQLATIYQMQYRDEEAIEQYKAAAADRNFSKRSTAREKAQQIETYLQKVKEAEGTQ
ncbi:MAG: tetratricopeptide repeat protein [Candidatus Eisenbacteria bacterium]|nr:tetratricopeptide repeat protein [Candidatus Eisenbacteria bacterium]